MAKTENISIKGLIQKQQLDNLNKSAEEQVQVLKNIEAHIQDMDMSTSRLETTEEKSLKLAQETSRQEKRDRDDVIKQAKVDSANRIKEAIANTSVMTQIALNTKTYKGPIEKIGDKLKSFGDKFSSVSNTLNTLGIVKKGTGGIVSNILEKREDKKEFIKAQKTLGSEKSKSELAKDYEESQKIAKLIAKNEALIKKQRGTVKESDFLNTVAGSKLGNRRTELASKFSSLDLRNKSKNNKEYEPSVEPIEMSAPIGTPTVVPTESDIPTPIGTPTVVPTESSENKNERLLHETKVEETLEKIEVNTRPVIISDKPKETDKSSGLGGLLGGLGLLSKLKNMIGGLFEGIGNALLGAFKLLFSPTNILKGLAKGFALGTLIASIGKGIYDGFIEWQKTGDIGKAIVEGLGGMIEFLTFGLISKDKYKEYAEWFNGKVDEYIIQPITTFISDICKLFDEWIATPIKDAFKGIGDFFSETMDSFMSMIQGIGIPEFTIPVPEWMGGPITLGPWYPFKDENISKNAPKESNTDKNKQTAAENKSAKVSTEEIKGEKSKVSVVGANNVVAEEVSAKTGTKYIPYKEPTKPGEPTKVESVKAEEVSAMKNEPQQVIKTLDKVEPEKAKIEKPWMASLFGDDEFKPVEPTRVQPESKSKSGVDYIIAEESLSKVEPTKVQSVNVKNSKLTDEEILDKPISTLTKVELAKRADILKSRGEDPSKNPEIVKRGVELQRESERLVPTEDTGWMNPQVETTPRPSIQEQLNNLDVEQSKFVKPEQIKPEKTVDLGDTGWMNPQVETTPRPSIQEQLNNLDAQQVYQKSAENVDKKEDMSTKSGGNTVVSAPTINTSNSTVNSSSVKLPTRNPDTTSNRYISSRYAIQ